MDRIYYDVVPSPNGGWNIVRAGRVLANLPTYPRTIEQASEEAREECEETGAPTAMRVQGRDGRVMVERHYGGDGESSPG